MPPKSEIRVLGLDIAAVNSGVCVTKALHRKQGAPQFEALFECGLVHGPLRDHTERSKAADVIKGLALQHKVTFAVIEDYAMRLGPNNTSAYQAGESAGMVKKALWESSVPFIVVPPTSMRSFLQVPSRLPDSGKQFIIDAAEEKFGFKSEQTNQNKRSNATDAFIHTVIGSYVYYHFEGRDLGELPKEQQEILHGNGKKMAGLVNMPELYFGCDWPVFDDEE